MRKQYHFWPAASGEQLDAWDVDRLIALSADLPVQEVAVTSIAEVDSVYWFDAGTRPTVREIIAHAQLIEAADPTYPIIVGPDGRVMDGMHRVARAIMDGRERIAAVVFTVLPSCDHPNCSPADLSYER